MACPCYPRLWNDWLPSLVITPSLAAVKSLQSCPTLCDPIDGSPPGSPRPWDSPGKNTGVGCHFFLQSRKVKSESEVIQSYSIPSNPTDCGPPVSSVHGIFQARVLECSAIACSALPPLAWGKLAAALWAALWQGPCGKEWRAIAIKKLNPDNSHVSEFGKGQQGFRWDAIPSWQLDWNFVILLDPERASTWLRC